MKPIFELLTQAPDLAKKFLQDVEIKPKMKIYEFTAEREKQKVLIIKKGGVKVEVWYKGKWRLASFYGLNGVIGIGSFVENPAYLDKIGRYRVIALTDGIVTSVDAEFFIDHMYANPRLFQGMMEELTLRYITSEFIYRERRTPLSTRLATGLISIINMMKFTMDGSGVEFMAAFTKQLIAAFIQVHPYRLNRVFKEWEEAGLITFDTHLIIHDIRLLEKKTDLRLSYIETTKE
ncbi:Crp/Fnr family transcriptional regulator [Listeria costaricensis]|uniref:Crp/Fnr family transcriptional regulator n=1 Tax=Listeria costaricensis TaxID=2026604 RepID=UPI000C079D8F|nr:helix-turn-helix domain-containing protein [Listeria costaricensis]